ADPDCEPPPPPREIPAVTEGCWMMLGDEVLKIEFGSSEGTRGKSAPLARHTGMVFPKGRRRAGSCSPGVSIRKDISGGDDGDDSDGDDFARPTDGFLLFFLSFACIKRSSASRLESSWYRFRWSSEQNGLDPASVFRRAIC